MGYGVWILLGLIAGLLAKWIMPGNDPGGIFVTIGIGVVGAFLGGYLGSLAGIGAVDGINLMSVLLAVGGSVILLLVYRIVKNNS